MFNVTFPQIGYKFSTDANLLAAMIRVDFFGQTTSGYFEAKYTVIENNTDKNAYHQNRETYYYFFVELPIQRAIKGMVCRNRLHKKV